MLPLATRAGLVALLLSVFIVLGACAPVPSPPSTIRADGLALTRQDTSHDTRQHISFPSIVRNTRLENISNEERTSALTSGSNRGMARREADEMITLIRRKSIGQKIKDAFHHLGEKIKHGFQKVGKAIKSAAQKVGHFFKETGKKIAKVALKVAAVATKAVSKVIGFIPGVGKAVGKIMEAGSKGLNAASDAIKCKIGGKLGTAMHRMNKGMKVMSYIP